MMSLSHGAYEDVILAMAISDQIEKFCSHFERQVDSIGHLTVASFAGDLTTSVWSDLRYKKVLYVTTIDTLAGFRFHKSAYPHLFRQNRERFTRFVKEYGSWTEGDFVSLPFLKDQLGELKLLNRPLAQHINKKLAPFSTQSPCFADGGVLVSAMDELASDLLVHATTEKEEEAINDYQHLSLLYRYRNSLVHESRTPGGAAEFDVTNPYYHGYIGSPTWHLAYPIGLFEGLLKRSLARFRAYLVDNSIDPYLLVEDKSRW